MSSRSNDKKKTLLQMNWWQIWGTFQVRWGTRNWLI